MPTPKSEKNGEYAGITRAINNDPGGAPIIRRKYTGAPRGATYNKGSLLKKNAEENEVKAGNEYMFISRRYEVEHSSFSGRYQA